MTLPRSLLLVGSLALLSACGSDSDSGTSQPTDSVNNTTPDRPNSQTLLKELDRYALAKGCYALQSTDTEQYAAVDDSGYRMAASDPGAAEAFYMQPATLGKYLLYTADERLLTAVTDSPEGIGLTDSGDQSSVIAAATPTDNAIWTIDKDAASGAFSLVVESAGQALTIANDGTLALGPVDSANLAQFSFVESSNRCASYPEMPTSVVGDTYKGRGVDKPIIGFADIHTHGGMSSELSWAGDVGPSAGGVLYGEVFHRFGVPHALEDCEKFHGPQGIRDGNNVLNATPTETHETQGWPTFVDWPRNNYLTHQVMYYRWVERAWLSGLRLMVNHGTNIAALCRIGKTYAGQPDADCDDSSIATKQINYLYEVQDYIDAQHGGPGKGWYRIVTSPKQAREVINDGKLAVILGVEVAQALDCGVTFNPDGTETPNCDEASVDAEIQRLWDLGVRHIYPYHDIDSALGGAGIFNGDVMNYLNFLDTGKFWETTECRDYPTDLPAIRTPGAVMATGVPFYGDDPLSSVIMEINGGIAPVYPDGERCNERTVTDLGTYVLNALMDRRMIIDIDHAAYHSKDMMLDLTEQRDPAYPLVSSHGAHGGLTGDQAVKLLKNGGIIYPYKGHGRNHTDFLQTLKELRAAAGINDNDRILGLGYGADGNGFGGHPGPRGNGAEPVNYPFTLFNGEDWGPEFAPIKPVTVDLMYIPESGKFWSIDEVGMAHYGMVADFVEEVRLEGGQEALEALYNSAESYVQMWERVYNRGAPTGAN